ncbi:hypothetical protein [Lutibacter maritimus]|nr:hypothetical protein [Lutibacter maritimus]
MRNLIRLSKPTEAFFRKSIKDIDKNSRDITKNYKYKNQLGLAFANTYGEQARDFFHIICKPNANYDKLKCNVEYTEYLKVKDNREDLSIFFHLYGKDLMRRLNEIMKAVELENNAKNNQL